MLKQNQAATRPGRAAVGALLLLALLVSAARQTPAQNPDNFQAERERAIQLINESKFDEALPVLERLAASSQADGQVVYGLGIALLMTADKVKDQEGQRKARLRARESLVRAQQMGVADPNLAILIKTVKPNGALAGVSDNKEANEAMRVASEAFAAKDGKLSESFAKAYPNEKTYRHSLAEEVDALRMVIDMVKESKNIKQLEPSLAKLVKLHDAGLLEPYILFARADQGIAQDFADYRKANRDKLRRYLLEYVVKGGGN